MVELKEENKAFNEKLESKEILIKQLVDEIKFNEKKVKDLEDKPIEHENKALAKKVDDINNEKENMRQELDNINEKLKNTKMYQEEAELNNHKSIGIWMARESEIESMMQGKCPYCDIKFKKMSTMINHYILNHGGSCPSD